MQKYGFVYIWYDKKNKRYYIGSHWGHEDDGYVCSSRWMRNAYKRRPKDFKRRILSRIDTSKRDLLDVEGKWLSLMKPEELKGVRYYNMNLSTKPGHWTAIPGYGKTIGEKISASHRANPEWGAWSKGITFSEEHRLKLSKAKLGNTNKKGKKVSEEGRKKMSEAKKGKIPWNKGLTKSHVLKNEKVKNP